MTADSGAVVVSDADMNWRWKMTPLMRGPSSSATGEEGSNTRGLLLGQPMSGGVGLRGSGQLGQAGGKRERRVGWGEAGRVGQKKEREERNSSFFLF